MRTSLPKNPKYKECSILNLDRASNNGTHWVSYIKNGNDVIYFDSFGNLKPPKELITYLGSANIRYNYNQFQNYNSVNCGHLCLRFLYNNSFK